MPDLVSDEMSIAPPEHSDLHVSRASLITTGSIVIRFSTFGFHSDIVVGVGPTLGSLLATAFYTFLKWVHYW